MSSKILSRLNILGELYYDSPRCILEDIIESSGITLEYKTVEDKYLHRHKLLILARKVIEVNVNLDNSSDLRIAATYINPNCSISWTSSSIKKALIFLESFHGRDAISNIPMNFNFGYQQPNELYNINICIIFRACIDIGIRPSYDITPAILIDSVRLYQSNMNLKSITSDIINNLNSTTLRSLIVSIALLEDSTIIDDNQVKIKSLEEGIIVSRIHPKLSTGISLYDKFDTNVDEDHYSIDVLQHYCTKYNIPTDSEFGVIKRILTEPTWHKFDANFNVNSITPIYRTEVSSHTIDDLYQYGILNTTMDSFSESSLIAYFTSSFSFVHPIDNSITMSDFNMSRLEYISSSSMRDCIHLVRSYLSSASEQQQNLIRIYTESTNKDIIIKFFWRLHDLGMAMRGWDLVSTEMPITKSEPDDQFTVDIKVTECVSKLLEIIDSIANKEFLLSLPTLRMTKGNLIMANPSDVGYTIEQRIELVRNGNQDDVNSCIRINSNWIVASSYVYLNYLGQHNSYDILDLREIS